MSHRVSNLGVIQSVAAAELVGRLTTLVVELAERVEKLEARAMDPPVRLSEPDRLQTPGDR